MKDKSVCLLIIAVMILSGCYHDNSEFGVDFSALPTHGLAFVPYKERDYEFGAIGKIGVPTSVTEVRDTAGRNVRMASSIDGIGLARGLTEGLNATTIHQVSGTYLSDDGEGNKIPLSGAVYYPKRGRIKGIIVSCHYTVCADYEVPSQTCFIDAWIATKGYVLIMPDYMGYGSSSEYVHPYFQGEMTGRHVTDMILAVRSFLADRKIQVESPEIILTGYSQGAHAVMHTLRMIEDKETYKEYTDAQIRIKKCMTGGGMYSVSDFYEKCCEENYVPIPCAVPMLVLGMNVGRKNAFDPEYFFTDLTLNNYEEWILSKRYSLDQINEMIGTGHLSTVLKNKAFSGLSDESKAFNAELRRHDVPSDFAPEAPLWIFHSRNDDVVDFSQAELLREHLEQSGVEAEYDFGDYGVHGLGYVRFLMKVYSKL
ncbi:MAG: prolyl oligopeptidase family serine peptidase [Paludibacteraceae bacterium]|nr:prolyl oligopeptidase family serine peptidase [Paludibacteraceae bacterium]